MNAKEVEVPLHIEADITFLHPVLNLFPSSLKTT